MPKLGMEPIRRNALVAATIHEIGTKGSLDVTVGQIARRAGVSTALAHHYFGTKEAIFLSAMRHIMTIYAGEVRAALAGAETPRARLEAVVRASFAPSNFKREVIASWLMFYLSAQTVPEAARLLAVYKGRLASNLRHPLRPLLDTRADAAAEGIAAMIDGLYIRQGLNPAAHDAGAATNLVLDYVDRLLGDGA